jgi:hypothetical protein
MSSSKFTPAAFAMAFISSMAGQGLIADQMFVDTHLLNALSQD